MKRLDGSADYDGQLLNKGYNMICKPLEDIVEAVGWAEAPWILQALLDNIEGFGILVDVVLLIADFLLILDELFLQCFYLSGVIDVVTIELVLQGTAGLLIIEIIVLCSGLLNFEDGNFISKLFVLGGLCPDLRNS